jgi:hypothetical protein
MDAIKAVEQLIWKKKEIKNLRNWLVELDINEKPVHGVHWRDLKKVIERYSEELEQQTRSLEYKINKSIGDTEVK